MLSITLNALSVLTVTTCINIEGSLRKLKRVQGEHVQMHNVCTHPHMFTFLLLFKLLM